MKYKWIPGYFINALTLSTFSICNKSVCWLHLKWKNVYNASKRVWAFLWKMGMKLWKYQHQWATEGLCVGGSVRLLSSSRSYYLAVSNLFYIFLRLTPYNSGNMSVVYIISSKDSKISQLVNFIISSVCFVQASQHREMSLYEGKYKKKTQEYKCVRAQDMKTLDGGEWLVLCSGRFTFWERSSGSFWIGG